MFLFSELCRRLSPDAVRIVSDHRIVHLLTDSRTLSEPATTLFFALRTTSGDGHLYIRDLYDRGVRSFVISDPSKDLMEKMPQANWMRVAHPLDALQRIAALRRSMFDIPVIGITGSNGKTIVKEFLYQLLRKDYRIVRSPRSYNSQIGVPLSVWQMAEEHTLGIFEAGISQMGEMERLESIICPSYGIITNIGGAHQENFPDIKTKLEEKLRLFLHCHTIVYNGDCEEIAAAISFCGLARAGVSWSRTKPEAHLYVCRLESKDNRTEIDFRCLGKDYSLVLPFTDAASIEDIIHCITLISVLCPEVLSARKRFAGLEPVEMRMEVKAGDHGNTIINDVYSNDVDSLTLALDFQRRRTAETCLKKVLILSDILQSGMPSEELYRHVAGQLQVYALDFFVGIGEEIASHRTCFAGMSAVFFKDVATFLTSGEIERFSNSCILLKGARKYRFEQITERLVQQVHETALRINLSAIIHNLNFYRNLVPSGTKTICMVKAQGYGVGSYELVKTLQEHRVDYIAVAVADEGKELRERGISMPIVVMNPQRNAFQTLIDYGLEPEIYSFALFASFSETVVRNGLVGYPVHIKIDTGMHRLGFLPSDMTQLGEILAKDAGLSIRSVFTHLAGADDPDLDDFTRSQLLSFDAAFASLSSLLGYIPLRHVLNTAGVERFADYHADMIRLGIGLYGVTASGVQGLRPVATLMTTILQIKDISSSDTVGYGRKGRVQQPSRIAIIPIGYADGLDRRLSCGVGEVLVRGHRCPIVGNVCMDICMIDVTGMPAEEGDPVVVFGEELPIEEVARKMNTIPYEVLTGISPRVRRVYFQE
ncbi:bifunctional UDP-N-acetylmuramoyl-tripeptide:D-alanyl-D-alanine ligase/alanine racemase [Porphyromonas gingivalis]|uniref:bifunctional UDP-N-acetylmuramoyl-tripeptide:D-alanyl-D-alanine ligase/alanine racemase n=1 Tax=Porphyromonas gingivalis TaxID=837 RepID=UPI0007179A68|nr:bifunctional UDP-N-acetylmuramoyl-tripeptide:D-alanyl-D-alanine ligase/alanine racemase [Porphyromonas gingivalis]ALO29510.1 alanine racemase [Porphyromonas gingivalis A7A1-28]SJL33090.1 bifunctional UDP-N-acetylmuramoyl-tripeptide:D-alanyl-D-alanine ligase/alanine racemase [Porphyromonas gingivalis]